MVAQIYISKDHNFGIKDNKLNKYIIKSINDKEIVDKDIIEIDNIGLIKIIIDSYLEIAAQ